MSKQVIVIHGGETFNTYEEYLDFLKNRELDFEQYRSEGQKRWRKGLALELGDEYEVILPDMPNGLNAKYLEWKIWFEKFVPYFEQEVVLVGHSLGGIFLAKYLSEHKMPCTVRATFLIAAPYDGEGDEYSLADFALPSDLSLFEEQVEKIVLYQSSDDIIVSPQNVEKYREMLPSSTVRMFSDRGHFIDETFPELVKDIRDIF